MARRPDTLRSGVTPSIMMWFVASRAAAAAFLQGVLPLQPVLTTPAELLASGTKNIAISGRTALTVRTYVPCAADLGAARHVVACRVAGPQLHNTRAAPHATNATRPAPPL